MSTSAVQTHLSPAWKQEVNRRLAEHKGRKASAPEQPPTPAESSSNASRRAMEAAARVAARYAKAPSYSELLANEARAAIRAADAASHAALQAKAAAQSVLDGIEAASVIEPPAQPFAPSGAEPFIVEQPFEALAERFFEPSARLFPEPQVEEQPPTAPAERPRVKLEPEPPIHHARVKKALQPEAPEQFADTYGAEAVSVRWSTQLPGRSSEPAQMRAARGNDMRAASSDAAREVFNDQWWRPASAEPEAPGAGEVEVVEPAQPIQGNVIEFPRELVAARKARPRLAESPVAPESGAQLSIFEVDPGVLPAQPAMEAMDVASDVWTAPKWSGIELDAQPREEYEEILEDPIPASPVAALEPAPAGRRLMALVVDGTLVSGVVMAAAMLALNKASVLPGMRTMEMGAAVALAIVAAAYQLLFFTLGKATPGMSYAQIQLSTFEGHMPTRPQRWRRLGAMLLSVLPAGLGVAWWLFDDDHLTWHDRLSRTYLRRC